MKSCARIAAPDPSTMGFQFMSDSLYSQLLVGNLFHGNEATCNHLLANNAFKHRDLLEGEEALFHEDIKPAIVNANDASTWPNNDGLKNSLSGTNNGLNYIRVPNLQINVGGGQAASCLPSSNCLDIKPPINNAATVSMKRSRKSSQIEAVNAASKRQKSTPFLRKRASEGDIVEQPLAGRKPSGKIKTPKPAEPPKTDYVHVRARRGQATDSHSLAERVRREKISERMRFLQGLVPGCSKITGKALILDEIINYVQSLQHQVEFLALRLAAISPKLDHLNFTDEEIASSFVKVNEACTKLVPNSLATQLANFEMQLESLATICIGSFDEVNYSVPIVSDSSRVTCNNLSLVANTDFFNLS